MAAPPGGMMVAGARKPGHISCGNGVITSPITVAITVGGLQKPGNKAHRHTDGTHVKTCTKSFLTHVTMHTEIKSYCRSRLHAKTTTHNIYVYVCIS